MYAELHHPTAKNAPLLLDKITHPSHTSSRNALVKEQKAERKKKGSKGKGVKWCIKFMTPCR